MKSATFQFFPFIKVMRKIKVTSKIVLMIGAMLFSGDLVAYQTFSHTSSSELRIEVESIEEGEVRGLIMRSRQVLRSVTKSNKHTPNLSSSFNRSFIKATAGVKASGAPRFIRFCSLLH